MAATILFISDSYLKAFTPIGPLVDWVESEPNVILAQDSFIADILGTNFYNYMQGVYSAQTMSVDESTLMTYIKPALAYRVADQMAPFINYQFKNKGIMSQSGDYAQSVDLDAMKYVRNELSNRADFYAKRLSNYLCDNRTLFPQYTTNNNTDMSPHKGGYDSDLAFWH